MAFRRLAWHRSYFTIFLGLFMLVFPVGFTAEMVGRDFGTPLAWLVPFGGIPLCLLIIVRGIAGSWSKAQLGVDIPAGQLRLESGDVVALADVGDIAIVQRRGRYNPRQRHQSVWYQLTAARIEGVLYESPFEGDTKRRRDALDTAIVQAALRPLLERPVEGAAFRASPAIDGEALQIAGTPERLQTALRALARDHDATIRARATQLLRPR